MESISFADTTITRLSQDVARMAFDFARTFEVCGLTTDAQISVVPVFCLARPEGLFAHDTRRTNALVAIAIPYLFTKTSFLKMGEGNNVGGERTEHAKKVILIQYIVV